MSCFIGIQAPEIMPELIPHWQIFPQSFDSMESLPHAAAAPERGKSALDGVEAMNFMVNLMREHVPQETRMHYVITRGGEAPNVVPAFAESYHYVRHPDAQVVKLIFQKMVAAAEGAAQGTQNYDGL